MKIKDKSKNKTLYILLSLLWLVMAVWNYLTPQYADDLYYVHNSLLNIFKQGYHDYFYWNGRIVGQTLMRLLNFSGQFTVAIINSFAFVLLTVLVLKLGFRTVKSNVFQIIAVTILLFLFIPAFGQTVLWRSGAGNYLWTTLLSLFYIYIYTRTNFFSRQTKLDYLLTPLFFVLAILVGWSNENTSGGVLLVILLSTYFKYKNRFHFSTKYWLGIGFTFVGFLALLVSPGNKIRTISTLGTDYLDKSIFVRIANGFTRINQSIVAQYVPLVLLVVILFWLMNYYWGSSESLINSTVWLFSGVATIYALSLAPMGQDGGRSYFGGIIFIIIAVCQMLPESIVKLNQAPKTIFSIVSTLVVVSGFLLVPNGIYDSLKADKAIKNSYTIIRKESALKGNKQILKVPKLEYWPTTKYAVNHGLMEIGSDPDAFPNKGYQYAFRIKGVVLQDK